MIGLRLGLGLQKNKHAPADTTPSAFSFTDVADAEVETVYESDAIVVAGIDTASAMTITGGEYQINGGAWASTATTVVNGDSIKVRGTSSADPETAVNVVLTIGGVSDTFTITTAAGGGGEPEAPPAGFKYLVNADGAYILNADGAYILAKVN